MSRHLVLSGGPQHDFTSATAALVDIAASVGFATTVVTEPAEFFSLLAAAETGRVAPWSIVTVQALRWRMTADRYAAERATYAYDLTAENAARLDRHVVGGGGLLALHTAVICFDADPTWHRLVGGTWQWDRSWHPPSAAVCVQVTAAGAAHVIGDEPTEFVVTDEVYCELDVDADVVPLLSATVDGVARPLLWAREVGRGRVVTDVLGHDATSIGHPRHQRVLANALRWAQRRPAADRETVDV